MSDVPTARDYNRGSAAPVRRAWVAPALLGLVGVLVLLPFDGAVSRAAGRVNDLVWGDTARVLEWLGDYGQGMWIVVIAVVVWRLDPARRRTLVRWLLAVALAFVFVNLTKMLVGRPRPKFDEPGLFLGPFGAYPLGPGRGVCYPWEFWRAYSWELWSFPSGHAAYAAVTTVFLSRAYPPLRGLAVGLAALVCVCRVLFGAHYPADVVAGAALGAIAGRVVMRDAHQEAL